LSAILVAARDRILAIIGQHECTAGLDVRVQGKHIVLARPEITSTGHIEQDDRVRLTHVQGSVFGLSVVRHTGKWEKTPFAGTVDELLETILMTMQHLIAPWP
jgi:hypothetical protein